MCRGISDTFEPPNARLLSVTGGIAQGRLWPAKFQAVDFRPDAGLACLHSCSAVGFFEGHRQESNLSKETYRRHERPDPCSPTASDLVEDTRLEAFLGQYLPERWDDLDRVVGDHVRNIPLDREGTGKSWAKRLGAEQTAAVHERTVERINNLPVDRGHSPPVIG